jgi:hypothetical protein
MPDYYNHAVFSVLVRAMIKVAEDKRVITYAELENLLGLSHNMVAEYSRILGRFCNDEQIPLLNGLIVNTKDAKPSSGFDLCLAEYAARKNIHRDNPFTWGDCVAECWSHFHIPSPRTSQVRNYSGLTQRLRAWNPPI